jgi:hypothetical protein
VTGAPGPGKTTLLEWLRHDWSTNGKLVCFISLSSIYDEGDLVALLQRSLSESEAKQSQVPLVIRSSGGEALQSAWPPAGGVAPEQRAEEAEEQLEAPLVIQAGKAQKPAFPVNDLERTAAVFAALVDARQPLDARAIAATFRQGSKVEPAISRVLASLARLGHVHTGDGAAFALRRTA